MDGGDEGEGAAAGPLALVERKQHAILAACSQRDIRGLTALATSTHGLLDDHHRRIAWPLLLGCAGQRSKRSFDSKPPHRDEGQVKLDVDRSFVYYPKHESDKQLDRRKDELRDLITELLRSHPFLCYFQGFHDIVQVVLLVLGRDEAGPAVARLSILRIRDFMLPTISGAISHLQLLPSILEVADPTLARHLSQTRPFFALPATLTLYAHEIQEYGDIARLFDFLLAQEAVIPVYLFAVIICSRKDELLQVEPDEPEMLHAILTKLPRPLQLEDLISRALALFQKFPPETLPFRAWPQVSPYSALKTARDPVALSRQTLAAGEALFNRHAAQLHRQQLLDQAQKRLWTYRRPARTVGLAVLVGVLSWWLSRNGSATAVASAWRRTVTLLQWNR